jgi:hypothetical protein
VIRARQVIQSRISHLPIAAIETEENSRREKAFDTLTELFIGVKDWLTCPADTIESFLTFARSIDLKE